MGKSLALKLIFLVGLINAINGDSSARVVCYYDTRSSLKEGKINRLSNILRLYGEMLATVQSFVLVSQYFLFN